MYNYLKQFLLFLSIFLLWQCGQGTDPVMPTPVQTNRLLTGASDKTWMKVSSKNNDSEGFSDCELGLEERWKFNTKDTVLTIYRPASCNGDIVKGKFLLDTLQNRLRLRFVPLDTTKEIVTRIITYITDKEFTAEYHGLSPDALIETFRKVDQ